MALCCPPGRGCNCLERDEPCILELCRQAMDEERAALAVRRWETLQDTPSRSTGERRFRARAYERARDRALPVLLMRAQLASASGGPKPLPGPGPTESPQSVQIAHAMTRLDALLRHYRARSRRLGPPVRERDKPVHARSLASAPPGRPRGGDPSPRKARATTSS